MRVAYLSHVDSRWIKQRPQFLAEALNHPRGISVAYFCSIFVTKRLLVREQSLDIPVFRLPLMPQRLRRRLAALDSVLGTFSGLILLARWRPDVLVVTHARHLAAAVVARRFGVRIFYDCMDLNRLFPDVVPRDGAQERKLLGIVEAAFCSSSPIAEDILKQNPNVRTVDVPNALDSNSFVAVAPDRVVYTASVRYVGTISTWFDMDAVLELLRSSDATVELYGPADIPIPEHDRLLVHGVVSHNEAMRAMREADVLVLPFKITELIAAVDPVKVYEYVASGRPVVCRDYEQLDHFGGSISRYSSSKEFVEQVQRQMGTTSLPGVTLTDFVDSNCWVERAKRIAANF